MLHLSWPLCQLYLQFTHMQRSSLVGWLVRFDSMGIYNTFRRETINSPKSILQINTPQTCCWAHINDRLCSYTNVWPVRRIEQRQPTDQSQPCHEMLHKCFRCRISVQPSNQPASHFASRIQFKSVNQNAHSIVWKPIQIYSIVSRSAPWLSFGSIIRSFAGSFVFFFRFFSFLESFFFNNLWIMFAYINFGVL